MSDPLAIGEAVTGIYVDPVAWAELKDWRVHEQGSNEVFVYAQRDSAAGRATKGHLQCSVRDLRVLAILLPAFIAEYDERIAAEREED